MPNGSYGKILFSNDGNYAYKFIYKQNKDIYGSSILKEIDFLKRCNHPNIVKIENIMISKNRNQYDKLCIIMKKADANLYEHIKKNKLDEIQFREIVYQMILSLCYIHSNMICHRDIKPDNFLMFGKTVKLSDFGLSINMISEWTKPELCSIERYRAPEIYCKKEYNFGIDIWALGCIIYEMYSGKCLFRGNTSEDMIYKIIHKTGINKEGIEVLGLKLNSSKFNLKINNSYLLELVKGMLDTNPRTRLTAMGCLQSHYFVSLGSGYFYDILQTIKPQKLKKADKFMKDDICEKFTKSEITLSYDIFMRFGRYNSIIRNICLYMSHKLLSKTIKPYKYFFDDIDDNTYENVEMKILEELNYKIFRFTLSDIYLDDKYDILIALTIMEEIEYEITLKDLNQIYKKTLIKSNENVKSG